MNAKELGETLEMRIQFEKMGGLIPAIAQDAENGEVLMLGYMNEAALKQTVETGKATYYSRRSKKLWTKGESSGNYQQVKEIYVDCDQDTLLLKVQQTGSACEFGYKNCFYRTANGKKLAFNQKQIQDTNEIYGEKYSVLFWNPANHEKSKPIIALTKDGREAVYKSQGYARWYASTRNAKSTIDEYFVVDREGLRVY